jgi:hypothetical protein
MSTVKVINIQHPSAASPNIVGDANGNITFAGTAAMASSFIRNRIINGAFDFWQRGTSFTSSSVNEYSADRWRTEGYNTSSVISQQTFTVGQTAVPGYPRYFCRVTTSSAPSNYWAFQQRIECPQNINGDGTYTLSFWVKAVSGTIAAGTFKYGINDNSTYSNPAITTTWQKISVTQTLSGISESSGYLSIYIISIGTGVSSLSVDIANVQVEVGSVATPFEREAYPVTLAKCQRYYEKSYNQTVTPGSAWSINGAQGIGGSHPTANFRFGSSFKVSKRTTTPIFTVYDSLGASGAVSYYTSSWLNGGTSFSVTPTASDSGFYLGHNIASSLETQFAWVANAEL